MPTYMKKSYDSIYSSFFKRMLIAFEFPDKFIELITECDCTPNFFLCLMVICIVFLKGKWVLRSHVSPSICCLHGTPL